MKPGRRGLRGGVRYGDVLTWAPEEGRAAAGSARQAPTKERSKGGAQHVRTGCQLPPVGTVRHGTAWPGGTCHRAQGGGMQPHGGPTPRFWVPERPSVAMRIE